MRRSRRYLLAILFLLFTYSVWQLWDINRVGKLDTKEDADCAIVLGAAAWHNKPSPVLEERLNHAIELFKSKRVEALLLTGGHGAGAPFSESEVSLEYCVKQGIPREAIRIETSSGTTLENLTEAKKILLKEGWKTSLLVSDPWHLKRASKMATDLDMTVFNSATSTSKFQSFGPRSRFLFNEFVMLHCYFISGK
ncbi:YdcF family protein [Akkermansiaceae bacterium]|nr:YdcF family protein [Akkermansiaceae bacterium]